MAFKPQLLLIGALLGIHGSPDYLQDAPPTTHFRSRGTLVNVVSEGHILFDMHLHPIARDLSRAIKMTQSFDAYARDLGKFTNANGSKPWQVKAVRPALSAVISDCRTAEFRLRTIYDMGGVLYPAFPEHLAPKRRNTRQVMAVLAGSTLGWIGSKVTEFFSGSSVNPEQSISDLESNEKTIAASLAQHEHETAKHFKELSHVEELLETEMDTFIKASRWTAAAQLCITAARAVIDHTNRVTDGVLQLFKRREVPGQLIAPYYLDTKLSHIQRQAAKLELEPLFTKPIQILAATTESLIYKNGTIRGVIRIPLIQRKHRFAVYQHLESPLLIESNVTSLVQVHPERPFVAVVQHDDTLFFSLQDLHDCPPLYGEDHVCDNHVALRTRGTSDCAFSLFSGSTSGILESCPIHAVPKAANVWTLNSDAYLIYHPEEAPITVSCQVDQPSEQIYTTSFTGLKELHLPPRCKAYTAVSTLMHYPNFANEQLTLNISASPLVSVLPSVADSEQTTGFVNDPAQPSPFVYHDPKLRPVRHPESPSLEMKILGICGPIALGGLLFLIIFLFCKYKQKVRTVAQRALYNQRERPDVELALLQQQLRNNLTSGNQPIIRPEANVQVNSPSAPNAGIANQPPGTTLTNPQHVYPGLST